MFFKTKIIVTWNESYDSAIGDMRFVSPGSREFYQWSQVDILIADLGDADRVSMFEGRNPRIENVEVREETVTVG